MITIITDNDKLISVVTPIFDRHNLTISICFVDDIKHDAYKKLAELSHLNTEDLTHSKDAFFILHSDSNKSELITYSQENSTYLNFTEVGVRSAEILCSRYVLEKFKTETSELSSRNDVATLEQLQSSCQYVDFTKNHKDWVTENPFIKKIESKLYNQLINFVFNERGLFLKIWSFKNQKNYWNSTFNGGLPVVKKRDPIHEGTFMLHDIWHFVFTDPVITGNENELEIMSYIAHRLMSEAFTLVLTDMMAVDHSKIEQSGYDVTKRKIIPVFKKSKLSSRELTDIKKLLYANAVFALLGDLTKYEELVENSDALTDFEKKYSIFFAVDLEWNLKNITSEIQTLKANIAFSEYLSLMPADIVSNSTHSLFEKIRHSDAQISFDKLFSIFWNEFISVINYNVSYNKLSHTKLAIKKYLTGQIYIVYIYKNELFSQTVLSKYKKLMSLIATSDDITKILFEYKLFQDDFIQFLNNLESERIILPDEKVTYALGVPHFPPVFSGYDNPSKSYRSLKKVSDDIFSNHLHIKNGTEEPEKINSELIKHFKEILPK